MFFGVILPSFGPAADQQTILQTTKTAEELGFESVWLTDHLALPESDADRFGHIYEAITTLAYLAGVTQRVKLGISLLVLPQRNPVEVAKEIATIDSLSNGRVQLALGVGWSQGEYANLGADFHDRGRRMDEAIRVLRTLWSTTISSFDGGFYQVKDAVISPQPAQAGGPPLWIGGNSKAALRRAIALGDGWHPNAQSPDILGKALKPVRDTLLNRKFEVCLRMHLDFNRNVAPAQILAGSTDTIIQQIRDYQAAGMTGALIDFDAENQKEREKAMQRFAREVMPVFR